MNQNGPSQNQKLQYKHGKESPGGVTILGVLMIAFGVLLFLFEGYYLGGSALFAIGLAIVISYSGIIIDLEKNRYKNYVWVFGLKIGKWNELNNYRDLLVLRRKSSTGYNLRGMTMQSLSSVEYELLFANSNHIHQILICKYNDKEAAYEEAGKLEYLTQRELVQYNPSMRNPRKKLL